MNLPRFVNGQNENSVSASLSQTAQGGALQNEEFIGGRKLDF